MENIAETVSHCCFNVVSANSQTTQSLYGIFEVKKNTKN